MDVKIVNVSLAVPFGRHKDKPLGEVPSSYLQWLIRECKLSSGLRAAVADELRRRNLDAPAPAPPRPLRPCRDHPQATLVCRWFEDALGRRRVRADCAVCHRHTDYPPCVPPYTTLADSNASKAPVLDALTWLEKLGIELESDGRSVQVPWRDWQRVPPELHALLRQCSHQLARMIGPMRRAT
jgi:hypothetical protein